MATKKCLKFSETSTGRNRQFHISVPQAREPKSRNTRPAARGCLTAPPSSPPASAQRTMTTCRLLHSTANPHTHTLRAGATRCATRRASRSAVAAWRASSDEFGLRVRQAGGHAVRTPQLPLSMQSGRPSTSWTCSRHVLLACPSITPKLAGLDRLSLGWALLVGYFKSRKLDSRGARCYQEDMIRRGYSFQLTRASMLVSSEP
jgi:hypothetical protein